MTQIGPQQRVCKLCQRPGMVPEIGPYHTFLGKLWAHSACVAKLYADQRVKEQHEHGDGA